MHNWKINQNEKGWASSGGPKALFWCKPRLCLRCMIYAGKGKIIWHFFCTYFVWKYKDHFTSRITSPADSVAVVLFWKLFKAWKDGVSQAISIIMPWKIISCVSKTLSFMDPAQIVPTREVWLGSTLVLGINLFSLQYVCVCVCVGGGVLCYFRVYKGSGHFWGLKILNFIIFGGFQKKIFLEVQRFCGYFWRVITKLDYI